ncbi:MAG: hypothetical protein U9R07_13635 [Pseudomonadota bacterium]|nr:hypothetical protein [Pseudomonadota bacterium]
MNEQASRRRSSFFANGALVIAGLVLLSFAGTYFVPMATKGESYTLLRHLHGLTFFAWVALYVIQTRLVLTGGIRLHRELGIAGVAIAGAMLPLGIWMAQAAGFERMGRGAPQPFETSFYNLADMTLFSLAFGAAIYAASRHVEWHRRLMFIAALNLLGPAISRLTPLLPLPFPWADMAPSVLADTLLIALAIHDRRQLGRIHPATALAALLLVPFHVIDPFIVKSAWWNGLAPALFGAG